MKECIKVEQGGAHSQWAVLMIGGFMAVGTPQRLIDALVAAGHRNLTVIANDSARPGMGIGKLMDAKAVKRLMVSHIGANPRDAAADGFGDGAEIERTRAEIETATGVRVLYHGADMSQPEQIVTLMQETKAQLGGVDIVVNNAGIQKVAPIEEFPVDKWDAILAINLSSAFHTIRVAVPWMKAKRWGGHYQHRVGPCDRCLALQIGLCGGEARTLRFNQDRG